MISRTWATPLVFGAFLVSAVTGTLLFFEADTSLGKLAHQWLGWLLVAAAGLHVWTNRTAFGAHLASTRGRIIGGAFVLVVLATVVPWPTGGGGGGGEGHQHQGGHDDHEDGGGLLAAEYALTHAPLEAVAPLTGRDVDALVARLRAAGFDGARAGEAIDDFAGGRSERDRALGVIFSPE
jgi:hypothetical protein